MLYNITPYFLQDFSDELEYNKKNFIEQPTKKSQKNYGKFQVNRCMLVLKNQNIITIQTCFPGSAIEI